MQKTEPMKNTNRQSKKFKTRKDTYAAKVETLRRKKIRSEKYSDFYLVPHIPQNNITY